MWVGYGIRDRTRDLAAEIAGAPKRIGHEVSDRVKGGALAHICFDSTPRRDQLGDMRRTNTRRRVARKHTAAVIALHSSAHDCVQQRFCKKIIHPSTHPCSYVSKDTHWKTLVRAV